MDEFPRKFYKKERNAVRLNDFTILYVTLIYPYHQGRSEKNTVYTYTL